MHERTRRRPESGSGSVVQPTNRQRSVTAIGFNLTPQGGRSNPGPGRRMESGDFQPIFAAPPPAAAATAPAAAAAAATAPAAAAVPVPVPAVSDPAAPVPARAAHLLRAEGGPSAFTARSKNKRKSKRKRRRKRKTKKKSKKKSKRKNKNKK
jgi:hypothetical protein